MIKLKISLACLLCRGDMIEVFKIVHDFYHLEAAEKLNFNAFCTTRENKYKLHKFSCHYNTKNIHLVLE